MKLLPKQRILMLLVASSEGKGMPFLVVQEKKRGAWLIAERPVDKSFSQHDGGDAICENIPYNTRVPANRA
jgi:hypothetical protein